MPERGERLGPQINAFVTAYLPLHDPDQFGRRETSVRGIILDIRRAIKRLLIGFPEWQDGGVEHRPGHAIDWDLEGAIDRQPDVVDVAIEKIKEFGFSSYTMFFLNRIIDVTQLPVITDTFGNNEALRTHVEKEYTRFGRDLLASHVLETNILRVNSLRFLPDNCQQLSFDGFEFNKVEVSYVEKNGQDNADYIFGLMKRIYLGHGRALFYLGDIYKSLNIEEKYMFAQQYRQSASLLLQLIVSPNDFGLRKKMAKHLVTTEEMMMNLDTKVLNLSIKDLDTQIGSFILPSTYEELDRLTSTKENIDKVSVQLEDRKVSLINIKTVLSLVIQMLIEKEATLKWVVSARMKEFIQHVLVNLDMVDMLAEQSNVQLVALEEMLLARKTDSNQETQRRLRFAIHGLRQAQDDIMSAVAVTMPPPLVDSGVE
jgi:hypothetical protein